MILREILHLLGRLPAASRATDAEALAFIENRKLMGQGIGFVNVHLLASAALSGAALLWTLDQRLTTIASELKLNYTTR